MALELMPNGEYVEIDDAASPDTIARIKKMYSERPKILSRVERRKLTPEEREAQTRAKLYGVLENGGMKANRILAKGALLNFDDELTAGISAATRGAYRAITKGDIGEIGREYGVEKRAQQLTTQKLQEDSPITATIGEIGGSLANPLGTGARLVRASGAALNAGRATRAGDLLTRGANRIDNFGPVGSAILAGGNTAALSAVGEADSDILSKAGNAWQGGAVAGGVLGLAGRIGMKAVQAIRDRSPKNADTVAYNKIADLLNVSGSSPQRAGMELDLARRNGVDAMLMDLSPAMRNQAGYLKRQPNLRNAERLEREGMARFAGRRERFTDQVADTLGEADGLARIDEIQGARRGAGQQDYETGGAMDKPFVWNDRLEQQFATATPALKAGLQSAVTRIRNQRIDPTSVGISFNEAGDVVFKKIPSMRVFDEVKRGFDDAIGDAMKGGNSSTAAALSAELKMLKQNVIESNPEYAYILKTQRDLFEQERAVKLGQDAFKRMLKEPRVLLKELRALPDDLAQDTRIGWIDTLLNLESGAGDPLTVFKNGMRSRQQRKVMEFMFDGKGRLGRLDRWVNRELRGKAADAVTMRGGQSITSDMALAGDVAESQEVSKNILKQGFIGLGFNGPPGMLAGIARALDMKLRGEGKNAQEVIAQILMLRDGKQLVEGTRKARAAAKRRQDRNKTVIQNVGKAAGYNFGTLVGS